MERVDVLVVGAGLGGLSASMFLAIEGVRVLTVERHPGTALHPRASGQTPRTMELYRFAGIDHEVLGVSKRASQGLRITVSSSLQGPVFHRIVEDLGEFDLSPATAAPWGMAGQDVVEPILLERARKAGADVRFSTELVSFEQDDDGVTAVVRSGGEETTVRASYLVAADGGRSRIREALGVPTTGPGAIAHSIGVVFDADLGDHLERDVTDLYYLQNQEFTGALTNTDTPGRYVFAVDLHPERGESRDDFPQERLVRLIRIATDLPGLQPEIRWTGAWEMAARIAERFSVGRVFLVGDAAKVTPPTGGMGGNTAVGDGHDIAWKIAAVVRGDAGPGLLDSYEAERKPIAEMVVGTSLHNAKERMFPDLDLSGAPEPVDQVALTLGFRYRSGAVLADDDDRLENPVEPSGRPGFRAPHLPTATGSTWDFLGHGWVLFGTAGWREPAEAVRAETGIALAYRERGTDFDDPGDVFGLGDGGASLVRPDGIVAWRAGEVADPAGTLWDVLARVLSR
ncbi:aklavinone 12-hydroxylase RdmE [Amycolatopsis thermophila]|uniref:2-polyprenyl-6-methoxyphenol hydroxylase-like FAD-dependent oxidoreductase n=1 Tax=Amycolatopsis thermophila TaxID=206084 RepID=A0ABU0EWT4_9PSEU|nr:FAD-dependent monooxygenase [Amycolatopsis thermophila]MDQ0379345.1 2-polyprenyl-6-methoxyphenol hydroxylase-like FAD-dependent oxidoreductase [Amycolatopsis thermophila]